MSAVMVIKTVPALEIYHGLEFLPVLVCRFADNKGDIALDIGQNLPGYWVDPLTKIPGILMAVELVPVRSFAAVAEIHWIPFPIGGEPGMGQPALCENGFFMESQGP